MSQGQGGAHVPAAQQLPQLFGGYAIDPPQPGKAPSIRGVVDHEAISLIEDQVPGLGRDLLVIFGKLSPQRPYLLHTGVVLHIDGYRPLRQQFPQSGGRGIILQ